MRLPKLKYLGTIEGLKIYRVSGEYIRNHIDIDFTQGGNESVYQLYVPKNDIWVDDSTTALDQTATALHEIVEHWLMSNRGYDYDKAHDCASETELPFRKELARNRPKGFDIKRLAVKVREFIERQKRGASGKAIAQEVDVIAAKVKSGRRSKRSSMR